MAILKTRYLTDDAGKRVAVVLDLDAYAKMLEDLEELEDIRAFDEAKASGEKPIPLAQALSQIGKKRGRR